MYLRDGFPGSATARSARPIDQTGACSASRRRACSSPMLDISHMLPMHGRVRRAGAAQAILIMCADGGGWCELDGARHEVERQPSCSSSRRGCRTATTRDAQEPWSIWWLHVTGEDVPDLLAAIGLTPSDPTAPITDPYRRVRAGREHLRRHGPRRDLGQPDGGRGHRLESARPASG